MISIRHTRVVHRRRAQPHPVDVADADFPARQLALRTLKSDVAIGLDSALYYTQDMDEPGWRISGNHAVLQLVDQPTSGAQPR